MDFLAEQPSEKKGLALWFLEMHIPDTGFGKSEDRTASLTVGNKRGAI